MGAAVVEDVLVDLVGDRDHVPLPAERGDLLELLAGEDGAGRVVRVAEDDGLGPVVEGGGQLVGVEGPAGGADRDEPGGGAGEDAVGPVVLVERLREDHLVARVDQGEQGDEHRLGAAAGDGDLGLGVDVQAEVPGGVLGDGLAEVAGAPGDGVLVDVGLDGPAGGGLDLGRGREVGHPLGQVDGAVPGGLDRHPADHALGEPRRLVREQGELHRVGVSGPVGGRPGSAAGRPIVAQGVGRCNARGASPTTAEPGRPSGPANPRRPSRQVPGGDRGGRIVAAAPSKSRPIDRASTVEKHGERSAVGGCPGPDRPGATSVLADAQEGSGMATRSHGRQRGRVVGRSSRRSTAGSRSRLPASSAKVMPITGPGRPPAARPGRRSPTPHGRAVLRLGHQRRDASGPTPRPAGRVSLVVNGSTVDIPARRSTRSSDVHDSTRRSAHTFRPRHLVEQRDRSTSPRSP